MTTINKITAGNNNYDIEDFWSRSICDYYLIMTKIKTVSENESRIKEYCEQQCWTKSIIDKISQNDTDGKLDLLTALGEYLSIMEGNTITVSTSNIKQYYSKGYWTKTMIEKVLDKIGIENGQYETLKVYYDSLDSDSE